MPMIVWSPLGERWSISRAIMDESQSDVLARLTHPDPIWEHLGPIGGPPLPEAVLEMLTSPVANAELSSRVPEDIRNQSAAA
jgi:hypothetical protein